MSHVRLSRIVTVLVLLALVILSSVANAPAPYWACSGKAVGDRCEPYGSSTGCGHHHDDGVCELRQGCTDDPATTVNECLECE